MHHKTAIEAVRTHLGPAYAEAIESHIKLQGDSLKHTSGRMSKHDNTLSDIGEALGDESMPSAKIVEKVRQLVADNKRLRETVNAYEDQWVDENV